MNDLPSVRPAIGRPSRLGAVWLTYRTRPLMWVMALVSSVVFTALIWAMSRDPIRSSNSRTLTSAEPAADLLSPSATVFSDRDLKRTNWKQVRSLQVNDLSKCEPLWAKGAMPRLETLVVIGVITDRQLSELCNLYELKSLTLYGAGRLTSEGARAWKTENRLQYLRLLSFQAGRTAASLEWPPNLKTLICDDPHGVELARLSEWRQLGQLETLSTRIVPSSAAVESEIVDELRLFPRLKRLFLIELPPQFPNVLHELQKELSNVRVRPHAYESIRVWRVAQIVGGGFVILISLAMQLSSQFVSSHRSLTPKFALCHFAPAVALLMGSGLVSLILLRWAGCSLIPSVALTGLPLLILGLELRLYRWIQELSRYPFPGLTNWGVVFPILSFALLFFQLVLFRAPSEVDWFVRGERPGLALLMAIGAIYAGIDLIQMYRRAQRVLVESGGGDVPLSQFDSAGWSGWGRNLVAVRAHQGKSEGLPMRIYDARMEILAEQLHRGKRPTSRLQWDFASSMNMVAWLKTVIPILLAAGLILVLFVPEGWSRFGAYFSGGGFQLLGSGLVMPILFVWHRRPMFGIELLRPQSRRQWVMTIFQGIARDLWPVVAVSLIFGVSMLWSGNLGDWPVYATANMIAIVFGLLLLIHAVGMWTFTLQSWGAIVLIGALGWVLVVACVVTPILLRISPLHLATGLATLLAVGLNAAGLIGLRLAFRRWMNWELGLHS